MSIANRLPDWVWNLRSRLRTRKAIDLSTLRQLRNASEENLADAAYLERLIAELGLCGENEPWELPSELSNFYDKGILLWQYPNQFSRYLCLLKEFPVKTYLEIGVRHGGTFITTIEYLSRFTTVSKGIAIDINDSPGLREYMSQENRKCDIDFYRIDSRSDEFRKIVAGCTVLDLVLVDGGHDERTLRNDVETVLSKTNIIALHDTASVNHLSVTKICRELQEKLKSDFEFHEFHEQYDSVRDASGGLSYFGITVLVRKEWLP